MPGGRPKRANVQGNAFSKRIEKHEAMLDVYFTHFNWCRIHRSLRVTPAMELGLTDRVLDCEWLVGVL